MKTEKIGRATIHNMDCMEFMKGCEDNQFDLAIVDPPYGIGEDGASNHSRSRLTNSKVYGAKGWDREVPKLKYFKELLRISKNQIIWGVNYFRKNSFDSGRIVWNKVNGASHFSDCEIAFCSFHKSTRLFSYMWHGMQQGVSVVNGTTMQGNKNLNEIRIHPTQKPVKLYEWLLSKYAKEGDSILDTHMGSGSIAIATNKHGFDLTACELDKDYYQSACKRIREAHNQPDMFTPQQTKPEQELIEAFK